jgi:Flp pilus assembly protein TadD
VFRSALAAAGLPARLAGAEDVQAAVAAIRAERPGVRAALRSAIDLLLSASPQAGYQADFEFAAWLEAADRCDDTPFRREARGALIQVRIAWLTTSGWPVSRLAPGRAAPPIGLPELIRLAERAEAEDPPVDAVVMLSKAITELTDSQDSDARLRRLLRVARDRHPNDPDLLREFGYNMRTYWNATREPRAFGEALGSFRAWIAVRPDDAQAYYYLGILLGDHGDDAEAAAAYRAALARNPKYNFARINLANALQRLGDLDGSIAVLRETVQLDPRFVMAHNNLGKSLERKGDLDGAVAEYKEALRLEPTNAGVHNSLGWVLQQKGELEGAVAEFKEAVRLDPKYALAHNNLGWVLQQKGDLDGAVSSYREAVRLDPKQQYAVANLPRAERMRALLPRLPGVLAGTDRPATAAEAVGFAELLGEPFQRRYAAAARFFEQAFSADPALADVFTSTGGGHRYDAACYAARAARGEGVDYPPDPAQRAALRAKALAWLRADLAIWKRQAASRSASERTAAAAALTWWLGDSDLSAVRRPFLLAALPAAEAKKWLAFWTDVRSTLAEAQKPAPPPETAPPPRAE